MSSPARSPSLDVVLLAALFAGEGAAAFAALGIYKKGERPLGAFVAAPAGLATLAAAGVVLGAIVVALWRFRRATEETRVGAAAAVLLNLVCVVLGLGAMEVTIRAVSVDTPAGPSFRGTVLLPKRWDALARRNREVLARADTVGSYLVFDERLGWSIAKSRGMADPYRRFQPESLRKTTARAGDLYMSSAEGLRSPAIGVSFAARRPAHRVALVGDSFTFGLEVPYEDTWGARLESALGNDTQVLNFGVDGFGVDQILLRYQRDVIPWHPEIVIFSVIADDLRRTFCVYAFLCFQAFGEIPFPKPRFALDSGRLRQINAPLPSPESVFARASIAELPFIEEDGSYVADEWQWHFVYHSYLVRFITSRFPRWPRSPPNTAETRAPVNAALFREFLRLAKAQGSVPLILVFPNGFSPEKKADFAAAFARVDVPFSDMTSCVERVPPADRFVFLHYAPAANAAVAGCVVDSVRQIQRSSSAKR